jgi:hypothetical protein
MKTVTLMALCAALGTSVLSTQAHAKSEEASSLATPATPTFELLSGMTEALAVTTDNAALPNEAIAGKVKDKLKHGWNSVKKGTSNLLGKRVKHEGKHNTSHISTNTASGRANLHSFLNGPKRTHRPMGPPR